MKSDFYIKPAKSTLTQNNGKVMKKTMFLVAAVAALSMTGCTTDYSGSAYDPQFVRMPHTVTTGTIQRMDVVKIEGEAGLAGTAGGGIVGGAIGSTMGGGSGSTVTTALGALGGALLGGAIEKKATTQSAYEFEVLLENGRRITIVQTLGPDTFAVGQTVRVLTAPDGTSRIRPN